MPGYAIAITVFIGAGMKNEQDVSAYARSEHRVLLVNNFFIAGICVPDFHRYLQQEGSAKSE
jgi:hypothetical protein